MSRTGLGAAFEVAASLDSRALGTSLQNPYDAPILGVVLNPVGHAERLVSRSGGIFWIS
jgi:hypothetical protein